jgi:hypothetical protein
MGDDNDSEIPNFVPIDERDQEILRQALLRGVRLNDAHRRMIQEIIAENGGRRFASTADFDAFVLRALRYRHNIDESEWELIVLTAMAERRSRSHFGG